MNTVPSVEEIYQEYHKQTIFFMKGFYPRPIKNFNKAITKEKRELLVRFQNFIKRNLDTVDWRLYIKANAQFYKRNYKLEVLGSLQGTKTYRIYISYNKLNADYATQEDIQKEIIESLEFIKEYDSGSGISLKEYMLDESRIIPITLTHIYSGMVSAFLYACLDTSILFKIFGHIADDVYFELFKCDRNDFLQNYIMSKKDRILGMPKIFKMINTINEKIKSSLA